MKWNTEARSCLSVVLYIAEVRSIEPRSIAAAAAARRVSVNSKFNFDTEHNEMLLYCGRVPGGGTGAGLGGDPTNKNTQSLIFVIQNIFFYVIHV